MKGLKQDANPAPWLLLGYGLGLVWVFGQIRGFLPAFQCPFRAIFEIPCFGCGGTRAVWFFLHGQFRTAFLLNPAGFFVSLVAGLFFLPCCYACFDRGQCLLALEAALRSFLRRLSVRIFLGSAVAGQWIYLIGQELTNRG